MRSWADFEYVSAVTLPLFLFSATFYPLSSYGELGVGRPAQPAVPRRGAGAGRQPRPVRVVDARPRRRPRGDDAGRAHDRLPPHRDPPRSSNPIGGFPARRVWRTPSGTQTLRGTKPSDGVGEGAAVAWVHVLPHQDADGVGGRCAPRSHRPDDAHPRAPHRARPPAAGSVAGRRAHGGVRARLLLGRREAVLAAARGVQSTAAGYAGGYTPNPTYEEVCSGRTGHTEAVLVVLRPGRHQLRAAAEVVLGGPRSEPGHAPGQRRRHAVPQRHLLHRRRAAGRRRGDPRHVRRGAGRRAGYGEITTEIAPLGDFYYAEPYHQQYLAKNPGGYCPLHATGVSCA